jgi:hypothetical protein
MLMGTHAMAAVRIRNRSGARFWRWLLDDPFCQRANGMPAFGVGDI